jgi:uncharacterized membrane protein HdeD (DUF308 family)
MMKISKDWKHVAARAWSVRLALLAAVMGAIAATLPLFSSLIQPAIFGWLSMLAAIATAVARVVDQPGMERRHSDIHVDEDRRG